MKPFLKWVGGKTQIIDKIIEKFPKKIQNYHEIFLGGGSVLFALLISKIKIEGHIYAYDINEILIYVYKNIQENKSDLIRIIEEIKKEFNAIEGQEINRKPNTIEEAKTSKESYYYWMRKKFNSIKNPKEIEKSAIFIFLNKTCFRGVYREGPRGFNVPYGHYKNPQIITKDEIEKISQLIKDVHFIHMDFRQSLLKVKKEDFVYLDPPYAPENNKSFVNYTANGFKLEDHKCLFKMIKDLEKFLLSNSKVKLVEEEFKEYKLEEVIARRAINSKSPGSKTKELIIY